jgi:hypothetical protein
VAVVELGVRKGKTAAGSSRKIAVNGEKLVRERGAGSGEQGAGISSPNFLEF